MGTSSSIIIEQVNGSRAFHRIAEGTNIHCGSMSRFFLFTKLKPSARSGQSQGYGVLDRGYMNTTFFAHFIFERLISGLEWALSNLGQTSGSCNRPLQNRHVPSETCHLLIFTEFHDQRLPHLVFQNDIGFQHRRGLKFHPFHPLWLRRWHYSTDLVCLEQWCHTKSEPVFSSCSDGLLIQVKCTRHPPVEGVSAMFFSCIIVYHPPYLVKDYIQKVDLRTIRREIVSGTW